MVVMTKERTLHFIEAYKRKRILWDTKHPLYIHMWFKNLAWKELAAETLLTVNRCKFKVYNLRNYYVRTRMKIELYRQVNKDIGKSTWYAYEKLDFLAGTFKPRRKRVNKIKKPSQAPIEIPCTNTGNVKNYSHAYPAQSVQFSPHFVPHVGNIQMNAYQLPNQILENQILPELGPGQNGNPFQITRVHNHITHFNPAPNIVRVPSVRMHERNMINNQAMLNRKSINSAPLENPVNVAEFILTAEFIVQKLITYPPTLRSAVQKVISNTLIEADKVVLNSF